MFLDVMEAINGDYMKQVIQSLLKRSKPVETKYYTSGSAYVYSINNTEFIKFPKDEQTQKDLEKEVSVTQFLKGKLSVPVPEMTIQTQEIQKPDGKVEELTYAIMPKIEGETLWNAIVCGDLNPKEIVKINDQVADILIELHSVPIENVPLCGISTHHTIIERLLESRVDFNGHPLSFRTQILNHVSHRVFGNEVAPVFCHNDLHEGNIMICPKTKKVVGILDFGEVMVAPREMEFMFLNEINNCAPGILKAYQKKTNEQITAPAVIQGRLKGAQLMRYYQEMRRSCRTVA